MSDARQQLIRAIEGDRTYNDAVSREALADAIIALVKAVDDRLVQGMQVAYNTSATPAPDAPEVPLRNQSGSVQYQYEFNQGNIEEVLTPIKPNPNWSEMTPLTPVERKAGLIDLDIKDYCQPPGVRARYTYAGYFMYETHQRKLK